MLGLVSMNGQARRRLAAVAAAIAVSATPALADPLAVNPGLWEFTLEMGGAAIAPPLPADELAKMTPAQQDMLKKAMAAATAPRTIRRCITQAMLDKGLAQSMQNAKNCTVVTVSATSRSAEYQITCAGAHTSSSGTLKLDASDAQTVGSVMDGSFTLQGGAPQPMHATGHGHWLTADCGDVKPKD
jgi:hypothetical protein